MLHQMDEQFGVVFEVTHDVQYLFFGFLIDLEVKFGARFGVAALQILADHDEGHQQYLDDVGNEQIGHERWEGIERLLVEAGDFRGGNIVTRPQHRPNEDDEEKTNGADVIRDPHRGEVNPT